jgi:hypothetical protein
MECSECRGEGRILLFVSSRECEACQGTGTRQETPEKPKAAQTTDPPVTLQNAYDGGKTVDAGSGGSITITAGNATGSGGEIFLTAGDCATTGAGGAITLTAGNVTGASNWYDDITTVDKTPPLTLASGGGPECHLLTGSQTPTDLEAPLGSIYMRDDGAGAGSLWVKTSEGADGWCEMSAAGGSHVTTSDEVTAAVDSVLNAGMNKDALIDYVASQLSVWNEAQNRMQAGEIDYEQLETELADFPILGFSIPCVAPVSTAIIADMMAMVEQEGHQVLAFISSSRDFADIRKFGNSTGLKWEGRDVSYFGVPVWHSHKIEPGNLVAVADDRRLAMCQITR